MNPSWESIVVGAALFATMAAYALFAGADFGGGIWDLLAGGTERGRRPRAAIDASVTPVWEGNNVWIVLGFVLLWTAFPPAFGAVMIALFVPLSLSLLGIFCRGVGFAFRHEAERVRLQQLSGALFALSSLLAPFFLGDAVGAVAIGRIPAHPAGNVWRAWLTPTAILTGVLFVSACAYIGGVYMVADTARRGQQDLMDYFSRRSVVAGVVTGLLAAANLVLLHGSAPRLWHRLFGPALSLVIASAVAGVLALGLILLHRHNLLRLFAAAAVACVVAAWGVGQYPWLLPGQLTMADGSAPRSALLAEIAVAGLAVLLVAPSFGYLYWLQQHERLADTPTDPDVRRAVAAEEDALAAATRGTVARRGHPLVAGVIIGAAAVDLVRDAVRHRRG